MPPLLPFCGGLAEPPSRGESDAGTLAVRLDSPRVSAALALLEGIGQGDSLAALLGYQLERKLHDSRLDSLIFKLRRIFPFKTDQAANAFAATTDGMAVISARQLSRTDWGGPGLTTEERQKMEPLLVDLHSQFDALSDLMLTESVFQTVKGSPARSAAARGHSCRDNASAVSGGGRRNAAAS